MRDSEAKADSMVERVARVICLSTDADPDVMIGMHGKLPDWFYEASRAAIEAMPRREIVQKIVTRIMIERSDPISHMSLPEWQAFIEGALK